MSRTRDIFFADGLKPGRIMAKDARGGLHCGLCAERCPTAAWDMQKFWYNIAKAGEIKYGNFVQIQVRTGSGGDRVLLSIDENS